MISSIIIIITIISMIMLYVYIYIYIERERESAIHIYIYIYTHHSISPGKQRPLAVLHAILAPRLRRADEPGRAIN